MIGRRWLLPVGWAAFILALTSVPGSAVPDVGVAFTDKVVHLLLYAILGALTMRALGTSERPVRLVVLVTIAVSAFGAVDELHQLLVPGRGADLADWLADTVGGMSGAVLIAVMGRSAEEKAA